MTYTLSTPHLAGEQILAALGARIRNVRLRRDYTMLEVSRRAGISRETLSKVEAGEPSVSMGTYMKVIEVLELGLDISLLAMDDLAGLNVVSSRSPRRASRKKRRTADGVETVSEERDA